MTDKKYPRQHIAEQLSDLRAMRGKIEDLKIAGYGLLSGFPNAPTAIIEDLKQAMDAIDDASRTKTTISPSRIAELTPRRRTPSSTVGKRLVQSWPFLVIMRTPPDCSMWIDARQPSHLIS